jgi:pepF/M3 family oligoendopeptidase
MTTETLPHWDVSTIFPALDAPEFAEAYQRLVHAIDDLAAVADDLAINRRERLPINTMTVDAYEQITNRLNAVLEQLTTVRAYVYSFVSTDSTNTVAQAKLSEIQQQIARVQLLSVRFTAWIGSLNVEDLIDNSPLALSHAFGLRKASQQAEHLMSPVEEALAADLGLTGGTAWSRLYSNFTSQLLVPIDLGGGQQELPMTAIRNLAFDPDREVRRRGYEAELVTWKRHALPITAALNSIKGETNTLNKRRGWVNPLDLALFDNNIDRATLDAMMGAAHESFPAFRRYLQAKARYLQVPQLAWYDLFAPLNSNGTHWSFDEGAQFIVEHFSAFSARLGDLAQRAFSEGWIDAEPRPGKSGGAFCMSIRPGESRILSNFKPSFMQVGTLAHELGHAYHNFNLGPRTPLQRMTPMTLAETASIFCETIITQAALQVLPEHEKIAIIEASLQDSCQVVVDITSRFLFEQRLYANRAQRELSADELCNLMLDAQRETYGDGLDASLLHPYMWAVKPHYYGASFYNFPYMFGLLFGLGLYDYYQRDPEGFKAGYDDLLAATGMGDAAELGARFGIDVRSIDFWRSSFAVIKHEVDLFEALVDGTTP